MKNWTIEQLYDLWRYRGYTKKEAWAKAEKDYGINLKRNATRSCRKCFITKSKLPVPEVTRAERNCNDEKR